jgi:regulator of sigma E protease
LAFDPISLVESITLAKTVGLVKTVALFVSVLAVLIFVHELGHFLVARLCRVKVLTFAIGFGSTIFSRTYGDTEYALKAVPLGGYVRMFGEEEDEELSPEEQRQTFSGKTVWQRMAIVFAGPLFNLLTAAFIFIGVYMWGVPALTSQIDTPVAESPALAAGLMAEDIIVSINGAPVQEWSQVSKHIKATGGSAVEIVVDRGGLTESMSVMPKLEPSKNIFGEPIEVWLVGIVPMGTTFIERHNPIDAIALGLERTYEVTKLTALGIVKLIQRVIPSDTIGGPILIAQITAQQAEAGFLNMLMFVALLSVNLGVLNLLPIPVLDGGHLVFLSAEAAIGKPVSNRVREVAQQAGLFALLSLMVFAFYNDIMRLFAAGS